MSQDALLTLYLPDWLRWRVEHERHKFLVSLINVFEARGWRVELRGNDLADRLGSVARSGWALFYDDPPVSGRCLTMRQSYLEPFWRIEKSAKRWEFDVARAEFSIEEISPKRAQQFVSFWRKRLNLPDPKPAQNYVYVPLQGRLLSHRSFQSMSPIKMVETLLEREPRQLVLTLHPRENYSDAEKQAIARIAEHPKVTRSDAPMSTLLAGCAYVATQNSAVVISGYLLNKPALLFGQIDFHHIAASVHRDGLDKAFEKIERQSPDYARYLFWFFQEQALNVWRPDFPDRLNSRLADHGLAL